MSTFVRLDIERITNSIKQAVINATNEEELKIHVSRCIEDQIIKPLGINQVGRYEYTLISGARIDALYGHVIIEYKAPGKLSNQKDISKAKEQVIEYIKTDSRGSRYERYLGIIISDRLAFVRYDWRNDLWLLRGPYDITRESIIKLVEARRHFTLDEWLDVIINTLGLNSERYNKRQKLLLLTRLIPLVEGNVNIIEFGPRATGKTFLYRNCSNYVRIISGGNITSAALFYNLRTKIPGELAMKDCVVFDEISKVRFKDPNEMLGKLKDYMESGQYERGDKKVVSDASIVFMGNVQVEKGKDHYIPVEDLTYVLPDDMRDSALIDRIHAIIPGWEFPKIQQSIYHLSKGYGIASDYFAELMHVMRKDTLIPKISNEIELSNNCTIRDEKAIKRMMSGFIKLLFPDESYDKHEFEDIAYYTVELRQSVRDWLHKLAPGEFMLDKIDVRITL